MHPIASDTLHVSGYGAQNSFTTTCSRAIVDVLPKRTNVTVAIYKVIAATMTNNPPVNVPTQSDLKSYLDGLYGTQANVFFNVMTSTTVVVNYDLDGDTNLDDRAAIYSSEVQAVLSNAFTSGAVNVYYVNSLKTGFTGDTPANAANIHVSFIADVHTNSTVNITAHEIGHAMGLRHPPTNQLTAVDRLMWWLGQPSNPCRLIRDEWTNVNKNAISP